MRKIPQYKNIKHSVESNFDGSLRIICTHGIRLNREDLSNFPQPYTVVATNT